MIESQDPVIRLKSLIIDVFNDPCWRGAQIPKLAEGTEFEINKAIEDIETEIASYRDTIRENQNTIDNLILRVYRE